MKVQITFKLTAESRDELMATMAPEYRKFRAHVDELIKGQVFGLAEKVDVRWLLTGGTWTPAPTDAEIHDRFGDFATQGESMADTTDPTSEPITAEVMPPTTPYPETIELPIPPMDWCSGVVTEFGHIQNLCQQLSNSQWNIVQVLPVKGRVVGSEGYGVVAFRAQALRFIDQPPVESAPSNTPDDRYMGR